MGTYPFPLLTDTGTGVGHGTTIAASFQLSNEFFGADTARPVPTRFTDIKGRFGPAGVAGPELLPTWEHCVGGVKPVGASSTFTFIWPQWPALHFEDSRVVVVGRKGEPIY